MTVDPTTPEDPELERWLAKLGGKGERDDALADRLRSTVLKQQQQFEDEIDEMRLRRGRDRLLAEVRKQGSAGVRTKRARPYAIAASVFLMATAGLIGYQQLIIAPDTSEIGIIMSYGDLERPRGSFQTLTIEVDDPLGSAESIAGQLTTARLPFELRRDDDQTLRIAVVADNAAAIATLREILTLNDAEITDPGYYAITFELSD